MSVSSPVNRRRYQVVSDGTDIVVNYSLNIQRILIAPSYETSLDFPDVPVAVIISSEYIFSFMMQDFLALLEMFLQV